MDSISCLQRCDLESLRGIHTKLVTWRAVVVLFLFLKITFLAILSAKRQLEKAE